jgi:nucleotide-binding universal stress UspA family protein
LSGHPSNLQKAESIMNLKDILVHVDSNSTTPARLKVAIELAQQHDAHLTGLYVDPGVKLPPLMDAPLPASFFDELQQQALANREQATQTFNEAVANTQLLTEWRVADGELVRTLETHGSYADLLVVGQTSDDDTKVVAGGLADAAVLGVGRPVLVIPYIGAQRAVGRRVLVAWNGSRESVRAVNDALPLLQRAEVVEVMFVNPPEQRALGGHIAGTDISLHLARHGVRVQTHQAASSDIDTGDLLLSRAADFGADLIVMGAYGHSRIREFVFGGVTHHVLRHMTVPVLMSH